MPHRKRRVYFMVGLTVPKGAHVKHAHDYVRDAVTYWCAMHWSSNPMMYLNTDEIVVKQVMAKRQKR